MPNSQFVLIAILYTMTFLMRRASMAAYGWALATLLATAPLRVASLSAQPVSAPAAARVTVNHAAFDSLLRAHVTDGLVDYDAFRDAAAFRRYLASLARTSLAGADDEEQLAFWINVYNAYTIQLIVAHGERESIRNVNRTLGVLRLKGPWSEPIVRAAGRTLTLDDVQHRIIRKDFHDPRIHFVLINEAYKAANPGNAELAKWLDDQLAIFDKIYSPKRPRYLDGYNQLKAAIKPWGSK